MFAYEKIHRLDFTSSQRHFQQLTLKRPMTSQRNTFACKVLGSRVAVMSSQDESETSAVAGRGRNSSGEVYRNRESSLDSYQETIRSAYSSKEEDDESNCGDNLSASSEELESIEYGSEHQEEESEEEQSSYQDREAEESFAEGEKEDQLSVQKRGADANLRANPACDSPKESFCKKQAKVSNETQESTTESSPCPSTKGFAARNYKENREQDVNKQSNSSSTRAAERKSGNDPKNSGQECRNINQISKEQSSTYEIKKTTSCVVATNHEQATPLKSACKAPNAHGQKPKVVKKVEWSQNLLCDESPKHRPPSPQYHPRSHEKEKPSFSEARSRQQAPEKKSRQKRQPSSVPDGSRKRYPSAQNADMRPKVQDFFSKSATTKQSKKPIIVSKDVNVTPNFAAKSHRMQMADEPRQSTHSLRSLERRPWFPEENGKKRISPKSSYCNRRYSPPRSRTPDPSYRGHTIRSFVENPDPRSMQKYVRRRSPSLENLRRETSRLDARFVNSSSDDSRSRSSYTDKDWKYRFSPGDRPTYRDSRQNRWPGNCSNEPSDSGQALWPSSSQGGWYHEDPGPPPRRRNWSYEDLPPRWFPNKSRSRRSSIETTRRYEGRQEPDYWEDQWERRQYRREGRRNWPQRKRDSSPVILVVKNSALFDKLVNQPPPRRHYSVDHLSPAYSQAF